VSDATAPSNSSPQRVVECRIALRVCNPVGKLERVDSCAKSIWENSMIKPTGRPRGRPKGSKNKRTRGRELSAHRLEQNRERNAEGLRAFPIRRAKLMPLDVMEGNMEWACTDAAIELQAIFEKAMAEGDAKTQLAAFLELRALREVSQSFARDAAPYRHPKLHAAAVAEEPEPSMRLLNPFQRRQMEILERFGLHREA
jgi:hypothetical protein